MILESSSVLEQLIRENDLGWMIDLYAPRDKAIPYLLDQLCGLTSEFRNRFGYEQSFAPETLSAEFQHNPHRIRAFLQALGVSRNRDMLLMVWRILQGLSIREVAMHYREREEFSLSVTLARSSEGTSDQEVYQTGDIFDAVLLRNFGITLINGTPLFDGFLPKRNQ